MEIGLDLAGSGIPVATTSGLAACQWHAELSVVGRHGELPARVGDDWHLFGTLVGRDSAAHRT
ncbi:MAG: hypothetical protein IT307_09195 [Chloroflexi bacterium]|nr:hypothetical protein [Chloroflexota bacterium]